MLKNQFRITISNLNEVDTLKEYEYIRFKEEPGYMNFLDYNE